MKKIFRPSLLPLLFLLQPCYRHYLLHGPPFGHTVNKIIKFSTQIIKVIITFVGNFPLVDDPFSGANKIPKTAPTDTPANKPNRTFPALITFYFYPVIEISSECKGRSIHHVVYYTIE